MLLLSLGLAGIVGLRRYLKG
ncbi:MAG: hypothetical protein KJN62_00190 [Deltaproteobacteria bacterium]|nr:hypothetical protein [Deltaproteobacteria bacterium]